MYIPEKFKQKNIEELITLIRQYPFATLITTTDDGIDAMHLPVLLKQEGERLILKAHIAKANTVWKNVKSGSDTLLIFNGPNCYISPNNYPTKAEHGRAVPTWNYVVVHVRGIISFIHDPKWIYSVIDELTVEHESQSIVPWAINEAPEQYIQKLLSAIVGVEIEVNSIMGQWKLSQNQPEINRQGVIQGLSSQDDPTSEAVSSLMKKTS